MSHLKPVYWYEGLFLRPQHFQMQDSFQQSYSQKLNSFLSPFVWGFIEYEIVNTELNNQIFNLSSCEIIFQDGTYVHLNNNALLESRDFSKLWGDKGKSIDVYLGLMKAIPGKNNLKNNKSQYSRYVPSDKSDDVYDLYNADKKVELSSINYELQLFFGDEIKTLSDFNLIKLAELSNNGSRISIVDTYIPPVVTAKSSRLMEDMCRGLIEKLTSRCRELTLYKNDIGVNSPNISGRDLAYLMSLQILNKYIVQLHSEFSNPMPLPCNVYRLLAGIIAELSTYTLTLNLFGTHDQDEPSDISKYRHEDLYSCFNNKILLILKMLDEITAGPDYQARLIYDGTFFYSDLTNEIFKGNNKYYFKLEINGESAPNISQLIANIKVSSKEYLPILIARSLPGVSINICDSPPSQLARGEHIFYYEISAAGDAWDQVKNMQNIAVYLEDLSEDLGLDLAVIYGK